MSRTGGTIRDATSKQIVCMLRDTNPSAGGPLNSLLSTGLGNALGFLSVGTSLLNLGATLAINRKIDHLNRKIDHIKWVVEENFKCTQLILKNVNYLTAFLELEKVAQLQAILQIASNAQELEPGSQARMHQLGMASVQSEEMVAFLQRRMQAEIPPLADTFYKTNRDLHKMDLPNAAMVLNRFRHTVLASSLRATINAEVFSTGKAIENLNKDLVILSGLLSQFLKSFFLAEKCIRFDFLMSRYLKPRLSFSRIKNLTLKSLPELSNEDALFDCMRDQPDLIRINESEQPWHRDWLPKMADTFELFETATEDLDRLQGTLAELGLAESQKLSLQDYREKVALGDEFTEDRKLAFLEVQP